MIVRKVVSSEKPPPLQRMKAGLLSMGFPLFSLLLCAMMWQSSAPNLWGSYAVGDNEWLTSSAIIHDVNLTKNRGRNDFNYSVRIRYSYVIDGKTYWGERVSFRGKSAPYSESRAVYEKYFRLKNVPVYYAPTDRNFSVLEPQADYVPSIEAVLTLFTTVGLIALTRFTWKSYREWQSEKSVEL